MAEASSLPRPTVVPDVFDDPVLPRRVARAQGPYRCMAAYLPGSATAGSAAPPKVLPWFRGTWATAGKALIDEAAPILFNARLLAAATGMFGGRIVPNTLVVNVNGPMPAGVIHVDIPSFRGADRDRYSIQLLRTMGASGLFEPWRVVEAGAVFWSYDGQGGAFDYWPDGLDGPMASAQPPFGNTALLADNDRMYHRIGRIGPPEVPTPELSTDATIRSNDDGTWTVRDHDEDVAVYADADVRISLLWKARVERDETDNEPLTAARILGLFTSDLDERWTDPDLLHDAAWLECVHEAYAAPIDATH